jgi:CheY-like chemotaxis protein/HPt (histidine-containing phosphotransfer) domain-containing protein
MLDIGAQRNLPILLVIDDDLVSREVLATVLTMSGYTVHTAADGASALGMLDKEICVPAAILMDSYMPGLNGIELIKKLRERTQATLLVISGSHPADEVIGAADGFLLKPFTPEGLQKLLESKQSQTLAQEAENLGANEPVIDLAVLNQLRKLMPESAVREILTAVVADLGRRLGAIEDAIARHDLGEIRRLGHSIKGGCGMAGANRAARLGALLEANPARSTGNQLDNSARLLDDLRTAARDLERMLEAELPA